MFIDCLHNQVDCLLIFTTFFKILALIRCRLDGCTWKCHTFSSVELLCCFYAWKGLSFITVSLPSSPVSIGLLKICLKLVLKYSRKQGLNQDLFSFPTYFYCMVLHNLFHNRFYSFLFKITSLLRIGSISGLVFHQFVYFAPATLYY